MFQCCKLLFSFSHVLIMSIFLRKSIHFYHNYIKVQKGYLLSQDDNYYTVNIAMVYNLFLPLNLHRLPIFT